jgi:uncharacterized membrane protein (UPF0127 family)
MGSCVTGGLRNFKLDGSRGFLLHHGGTRRNMFAMADVAHPHLDQIASP